LAFQSGWRAGGCRAAMSAGHMLCRLVILVTKGGFANGLAGTRQGKRRRQLARRHAVPLP